MHQKPKIPKLRLYKYLHSVPRYLNHSIPIVCIASLLLLSILCINPILQTDTYAIDSGENDIGKSNLTKGRDLDKIESDSETEVRDTPTGEDDSENEDLGEAKREDLAASESSGNSSESEEDYEITTLAESTLLLTVANPTLSTNANPGQTAYVSSNVTYSASDITEYQLQVSYASGYNSLKLDGGTATLGNATGQTGSAMNDDTWGFAWGNTSDTNANMTYYTMPAFGTLGGDINNGKLEGTTTTSVANTTKKIVFAAKFASNNTNSGHYKTKVLLALTAPPKAVANPSVTNPLNINYMQEMTTQTCENLPYQKDLNTSNMEMTLKLTDSRDNTTYTIAKLDDGKCWMTQNLRLAGKTLNSADSDLQSGTYNVPASSDPWTTYFDNDDRNKQLVHYAGSETNGAYYTWCVATAGTCGSISNDGATAESSICPAGWTLPTKAEYEEFLSMASISNDSAGVTKIRGYPYNFVIAGRIWDQKIEGDGTNGFYWSSTSQSSVNAYYLAIYRTQHMVYFRNDSRYVGYSVRCIAK